MEETKKNFLAKAEEHGHVNQRDYVRQIVFYSLLTQATKNQLKKDLKRDYEEIKNSESKKSEEKYFN